MFAEFFSNGLIAGSIYALAALGYTIIYGVLGFVNFAHGEFMMFGAFSAYIGVSYLGLSLPVSIGLSFITTGLLGIAVERCAYRPLYGISRLSPVISSLGVSIVLRSVFHLFFGPLEKTLREPDMIPALIPISGIRIPQYRVIVFLAAFAIMIALYLWISKTRLGKSIRAVSQSSDLSQAVGVNLFFTITIVFFMASGIGGVSGALVALDRNLDPNMGVLLGFKGFTASVIGGIGSLPGALIGGLFLGLSEHLVAGYLSASFKDAVTFVFLIIFLLFLPKGVLGKKFRKV